MIGYGHIWLDLTNYDQLWLVMTWYDWNKIQDFFQIFQFSEMSLLPLSTTGSIPGVIKDHSSRNPDFAHFLMDETDFKDTFKETLQFINQNLKRKKDLWTPPTSTVAASRESWGMEDGFDTELAELNWWGYRLPERCRWWWKIWRYPKVVDQGTWRQTNCN